MQQPHLFAVFTLVIIGTLTMRPGILAQSIASPEVLAGAQPVNTGTDKPSGIPIIAPAATIPATPQQTPQALPIQQTLRNIPGSINPLVTPETINTDVYDPAKLGTGKTGRPDAGWESTFPDPTRWTGLPAGQWLLESRTETQLRYRAATFETFMGLKPELVRVTLDATTADIRQIDVVWTELGLSVKGRDTSDISKSARVANRQNRERRKEEKRMQDQAKEYLDVFDEKQDAVSKELKKRFGNPESKTVGRTEVFKTRVEDYISPQKAAIRFWAGEKSTVIATIERETDSGKKLLQGEKSGRGEHAEQNVQRKGDGDVLVRNLPMHDQGSRGYCAGATYAMVLEYWGMPLPLELIAARYKAAEFLGNFDTGTNFADLQEAGAKEAYLRMDTGTRPSLRNVKKEIDAGRPILVTRAFRHDRQADHKRLKETFAADPFSKAPEPKSRAEKEKWPTEDDQGHASIVTGYNEKRKEILLTESWGENNRNQRMSSAEFEETIRDMVTLEPTGGKNKNKDKFDPNDPFAKEDPFARKITFNKPGGVTTANGKK